MRLPFLTIFSTFIFFITCTPQDHDQPTPDTAPKLRFRFQFDENQARLGNLGTPVNIPLGNAAQTPTFEKLSVHVIDLTPTKFTPYGAGFIAYKGNETTAGGENAIDFSKAIVSNENEIFLEIPLADVTPGTYEYARSSVGFQQYDITYNINNLPQLGNLNNQTATIASFLGFNTYIETVKINQKTLTVNDNKKQGFWAFETQLSEPWTAYNQLISGEAAATTVVNPLAGSSDIPPGSCVITGAFETPLVITGTETKDITITLSYSINQSLEWKDFNANGALDYFADDSSQNEPIVDMGLRGLVATWE